MTIKDLLAIVWTAVATGTLFMIVLSAFLFLWHKLAKPAAWACPRCKKLSSKKEWEKGCYYCNYKD